MLFRSGASERREGCFELADRGTLFLDEIAEMTPSTQAKLLRVLQERRFRRLGGRHEQFVDVRVITATNANPTEAVKDGRLREDLFYRLNVFTIELPPLRRRKDDLPLLIQAFCAEFSERNGKSVSAVEPAAMQVLERYHWPGNVRELRNVIERAVILSSGPFIDRSHLPPLAPAEAKADDRGRPSIALAPSTSTVRPLARRYAASASIESATRASSTLPTSAIRGKGWRIVFRRFVARGTADGPPRHAWTRCRLDTRRGRLLVCAARRAKIPFSLPDSYL